MTTASTTLATLSADAREYLAACLNTRNPSPVWNWPHRRFVDTEAEIYAAGLSAAGQGGSLPALSKFGYEVAAMARNASTGASP